MIKNNPPHTSKLLDKLIALIKGPDITLWILSILVGIISSIGGILFLDLMRSMHYIWFGTFSPNLLSALKTTPYYIIILAPILAGAIVGLLIHYFMDNNRASSVADVIEDLNLNNSRMKIKDAIISALITIISLGSGASAGREGPVVHLGAALASYIGRIFKLPQNSLKTLLGCGVSSIIALSFNAPIAGAIFAHEVILGNYALRTITPVALSSVTGAVISKLYFGDIPIFNINNVEIIHYWEFIIFAILGIICAFVSILFQSSINFVDNFHDKLNNPIWSRPIIAGAFIGFLAILVPDIMGVGYESVSNIFDGKYILATLIILFFAKLAATAITLGSRFGGGVFSPSLFLGALTGSIFYLSLQNLTSLDLSSPLIYALVGTSALSASVLGAPISTVLIIFEMTGNYNATISFMLASVIACGLTQLLYHRSFFHMQLSLRGLKLYDGAQNRIGKIIKARDIMVPISLEAIDIQTDSVLKAKSTFFFPYTTLEDILAVFDKEGKLAIPVINDDNDINDRKVIAMIYKHDALKKFNDKLIEANVEENY